MRETPNRFGYCVGGEPTGDETPLDEWTPNLRPAKPCRHCGTPTTIFGTVCIDCELYGPPARIVHLHPTRRAA